MNNIYLACCLLKRAMKVETTGEARAKIKCALNLIDSKVAPRIDVSAVARSLKIPSSNLWGMISRGYVDAPSHTFGSSKRYYLHNELPALRKQVRSYIETKKATFADVRRADGLHSINDIMATAGISAATWYHHVRRGRWSLPTHNWGNKMGKYYNDVEAVALVKVIKKICKRRKNGK